MGSADESAVPTPLRIAGSGSRYRLMVSQGRSESPSGSGRRTGARAQPSPELTAEQVVALLLEAFAEGAGSGASLLWAFGTARLRSSSGDPEHLERILGNELFAPLVCHIDAEPEPSSRLERAARQVVTVLDRDQERVAFLFALSLAPEGERTGCWLVSGLERAV